ncbi:MAG: hypothetical protein IJX30_03655 [Clostridia bacterium]|nr:hypothetical protein [Clostridia bacterium]
MKGYVLSIVATVLLSAIVTAVLPEGKTSTTIKGIAKGLCVLIIISPILSFFQRKIGLLSVTNNTQTNFLETGIQTDGEFIQYFSNERVLIAQTQLENELQERYNLPLTVQFIWEWRKQSGKDAYEEIYISQIHVQGAKNETESVRKEILEYLTQNYCEEVLLE